MKTPDYWFPAKRYGWGWGLPRTWQGWVVITLYFLIIIEEGFRLRPRLEAHAPFGYVVETVALTTALIVICYLKGEPPRWRWGK